MSRPSGKQPAAPAKPWLPDRRTLGLAAGLVLATVAIFYPATRGEFLVADDPKYVTENPIVQRGLTWEGIRWAAGAYHAGHWHPVTWCSHLLDAQLYGLKPYGHLLTNILIHSLNAGLCLLVWRALTGGALGRSAFLAALWAWHPLRVESVAWLAERKDVLSTFFWLAALGAYAGYAHSGKRRWWILTLACYTLGLMSKPMVVTLPFVLLLLDVWPLKRMGWPRLQAASARALLWEKIPFFVLSVVSMVITVQAAKESAAVVSSRGLALGDRLSNALVSYGRYLLKWVWPSDLAIYYPFPTAPEVGLALATLVLLAVVTVGVFRRQAREGAPYLGIGWFWFLGTLIPVIGLIQAGAQAMADRFSYLPSMGLALIVSWGGMALLERRRVAAMGWMVATPVLGACVLLTTHQLGYWRDNVTLFTHACAVTRDNWFAEVSLGGVLQEQKRIPEALPHLMRALELDPKNFTAEANLGNACMQLGRTEEAIAHYRAAQELQPEHAPLNRMLGQALLQAGRFDEARDCFQRVLRTQPGDGETRMQLAISLASAGRAAEAVGEYRELLRVNPDSVPVLNNLAWLLATHGETRIRNGAEAVRLAERACDLSGQREAFLLGTLAAAYAEAGRFDDAIQTATRAIHAAEQNSQAAVAAENRRLLEIYKGSTPYHVTNANTR